ncbi:hypothetical protein DPMN_117812 [Dreissena polymorpha]|uniref:Uncharacterized protein n=1 Tax=Dreissena polymorpha TaxID=45954 RepID=A0A9D4GJ02_DREPO|nr:hypothetical protein DPMN_117812 [Dreissena polymorpha]
MFFLPIRPIFELNCRITETNVLTKFHEDWTKNVTSKKTYPPPGGHVFSPIWTIFELVRDIHKTNVLTKFYDHWAKFVTSREYCTAPGSHVFQQTGTILKLNQHIIKTNILTKLHEDWASNVTSTVLTRFFFFLPSIIGANVLTKFQEDRTINVATRVFTRQNVDDGRRTTDDGQKFAHLRGFHDDWAKNVTSRVVFTCFHYIHIEKNALPTGGHVFSPIWTIFELVRDIKKANCLQGFSIAKLGKLPPSPGSHVIELTGTIFELNSHIKETNVLTKFHENWAKNVTSRVEKCPAHWRPCFFTDLELVRDINKTNVLTNFHDDWANIVTSRVFTRKTAPPHPLAAINKCSDQFHENWAKNVTSRVFTREKCPAHWRSYINKTNVLTNYHDDWAKIVTSRVFTRKTAPPISGHVFQRTGTTFELNQHIIKHFD